MIQPEVNESRDDSALLRTDQSESAFESTSDVAAGLCLQTAAASAVLDDVIDVAVPEEIQTVVLAGSDVEELRLDGAIG